MLAIPKLGVSAAKIAAIEFLGGSCNNCGYDKHPSALEFHHKDPSAKDFVISSVANKSWDSIKKELEKCSLLCSNCHRIEHAERYKSEFVDFALDYAGKETFEGFFEKGLQSGIVDKIKSVKQKPHSTV